MFGYCMHESRECCQMPGIKWPVNVVASGFTASFPGLQTLSINPKKALNPIINRLAGAQEAKTANRVGGFLGRLNKQGSLLLLEQQKSLPSG